MNVQELYNWMPDWAKDKFNNCPIFHGVIMAANQSRLNREQTLWLLCEFLYLDRDRWKAQAMDLLKKRPMPIMIKLEDLKKSLK